MSVYVCTFFCFFTSVASSNSFSWKFHSFRMLDDQTLTHKCTLLRRCNYFSFFFLPFYSPYDFIPNNNRLFPVVAGNFPKYWLNFRNRLPFHQLLVGWQKPDKKKWNENHTPNLWNEFECSDACIEGEMKKSNGWKYRICFIECRYVHYI